MNTSENHGKNCLSHRWHLAASSRSWLVVVLLAAIFMVVPSLGEHLGGGEQRQQLETCQVSFCQVVIDPNYPTN